MPARNSADKQSYLYSHHLRDSLFWSTFLHSTSGTPYLAQSLKSIHSNIQPNLNPPTRLHTLELRKNLTNRQFIGSSRSLFVLYFEHFHHLSVAISDWVWYSGQQPFTIVL
ncbi:hypothetical protein ABKN59_009708 [Abortiporus biennis]